MITLKSSKYNEKHIYCSIKYRFKQKIFLYKTISNSTSWENLEISIKKYSGYIEGIKFKILYCVDPSCIIYFKLFEIVISIASETCFQNISVTNDDYSRNLYLWWLLRNIHFLACFFIKFLRNWLQEIMLLKKEYFFTKG